MFWGGLTTVPQDQPLVLADGVHGSVHGVGGSETRPQPKLTARTQSRGPQQSLIGRIG